MDLPARGGMQRDRKALSRARSGGNLDKIARCGQ